MQATTTAPTTGKEVFRLVERTHANLRDMARELHQMRAALCAVSPAVIAADPEGQQAQHLARLDETLRDLAAIVARRNMAAFSAVQWSEF